MYGVERVNGQNEQIIILFTLWQLSYLKIWNICENSLVKKNKKDIISEFRKCLEFKWK